MPKPTGRRVWLFRIAAAIAPLLLVALIEAGLRVRGYGVNTGFTRSCMTGGQWAFCDNPRFAEPFFPPGMAREMRYHFAVPVARQAWTPRIFVLGESAAEGDPDPRFGFARFLEVMLRDHFPGARFEVVNTSLTAINSHVLVPIARDVARYHGDVFLLYIGNNEVVGPYGPGTVLTSPAASIPLVRAGIFARSTRVGQLMQAAVSSVRGDPRRETWRGMEMFVERQVPADDPRLTRVYDNFRRNLGDIIDAGRDAGAHVIVSTVGTNLRDSAPFASAHRPGLTTDDRATWEKRYRAGIGHEAGGQPQEALEQYLAAASIDDRYADLQFRIGGVEWALGHFEAAKARFVQARELDALRFRADSRIEAVIRSVAATKGPGVELVDAEAALAAASPHGVPGRELFLEHVHLTPHGNYLLARTFFPRVAALLSEEVKARARDHDIPSEAECEESLGLTPDARRSIADEMLKRMERPPFTNQLNHDVLVGELRRQAAAERTE